MWGKNTHYFNLMFIWLLQLWGSKCNFNLIFGVNTGENHGWHLNTTTLLMIFRCLKHLKLSTCHLSPVIPQTRPVQHRNISPKLYLRPRVLLSTGALSSLFKSGTHLINRTLSSHLTTNWHRKNLTTYQINFVIFGSKHDAAKSRENMLLPSSCILFNNNRVFRGHRQKSSFKTLGDTQMSACEMALW